MIRAKSMGKNLREYKTKTTMIETPIRHGCGSTKQVSRGITTHRRTRSENSLFFWCPNACKMLTHPCFLIHSTQSILPGNVERSNCGASQTTAHTSFTVYVISVLRYVGEISTWIMYLSDQLMTHKDFFFRYCIELDFVRLDLGQ